MKFSRTFLLTVAAALSVGVLACKDSNTTTSPGALANVTMNAPGSIPSGQTFTIDVAATAVGVNNVQNGQVTVALPAPLTVISTDASSGTSATSSTMMGTGATVTWTLGTLDANSQSTLHINAAGTLAPGSAAQTLTLQAMLVANGISAGQATAQTNIQLNP